MKELDIQEALKLAEIFEDVNRAKYPYYLDAAAMIRRLVEELDKKQQGLVDASGMLFNYKYELDLERAMSAQLKEELEKHK